MGVETPLINGGEIKNAKRTVPLAIFLGIGGMLILVISIQMVTQGVLGQTITLHKDAPLAAVGEVIAGKAGFTLVIVATALSMLGLLSGEILSIPRLLFAGARDGLMPKPLAAVHPVFLRFWSLYGLFGQQSLLAGLRRGSRCRHCQRTGRYAEIFLSIAGR